MTKPVEFYWTGKMMAPVNRRAAEREYTQGEVYRLAPHEDRSAASHSHEFAWLHEAWMSLPEHLADIYPSAESLRKRALIQAGYYDEEIIDCSTNAAALRVAGSRAIRGEDFALVIVRGPLVIVRVAKSQSRRAMDRKTFQASKTAIMEVVASLLGTTPDALTSQRAA